MPALNQRLSIWLTSQLQLLDVGLIRLEDITDEFENRIGLYWTQEGKKKRLFKAEVNSRFDRDRKKIVIGFSVMSSEPTYEQMEEGCRNAMTQMHIWLYKGLPQIFLHEGIDDPKVPEGFYPSLLNMIEIRCFFSESHTTAEGRFWATHKLTDPGPLNARNSGPLEMTIDPRSYQSK